MERKLLVCHALHFHIINRVLYWSLPDRAQVSLVRSYIEPAWLIDSSFIRSLLCWWFCGATFPQQITISTQFMHQRKLPQVSPSPQWITWRFDLSSLIIVIQYFDVVTTQSASVTFLYHSRVFLYVKYLSYSSGLLPRVICPLIYLLIKSFFYHCYCYNHYN